jgi:ribose/xylose/arabinose/galactoside ABC-type transport system permease subunit
MSPTVSRKRKVEFQLLGLIMIILALAGLLTVFGGQRADGSSKFLNLDYLVLLATQTSVIAILAVGIVMVIITAGIDLSIGSIYALAGVLTALVVRNTTGSTALILTLLLCAGFGALCGIANGTMVANLGVHPFIITLGTMMVFRGFAFIASKGQSVLAVPSVNEAVKQTGLSITNSRGVPETISVVPLILTVVVMISGAIFLKKTTAGRRIYAVGGNAEAARYAGLPLKPIIAGAYVLCGLCAGLAAFLSYGYYGAVSSNDGNAYELQAIAAAVIGGTSLSGGKGNAIGAVLGALLIVMIRNGITLLGLDQNYERIIVGSAIVIAVVIDRLSAKAAERRMLRQS